MIEGSQKNRMELEALGSRLSSEIERHGRGESGGGEEEEEGERKRGKSRL